MRLPYEGRSGFGCLGGPAALSLGLAVAHLDGKAMVAGELPDLLKRLLPALSAAAGRTSGFTHEKPQAERKETLQNRASSPALRGASAAKL
jgi:hypothetical protein